MNTLFTTKYVRNKVKDTVGVSLIRHHHDHHASKLLDGLGLDAVHFVLVLVHNLVRNQEIDIANTTLQFHKYPIRVLANCLHCSILHHTVHISANEPHLCAFQEQLYFQTFLLQCSQGSLP